MQPGALRAGGRRAGSVVARRSGDSWAASAVQSTSSSRTLHLYARLTRPIANTSSRAIVSISSSTALSPCTAPPPPRFFSRTMASSSTTVPTPADGSTDSPQAPGAIDPAQNNSSGVTAESLTEKLRATLEATHVDVQDISGGCGQSFAATIVSAKFEGKMVLARHRLVNAAVRDEVGRIHAWTPKCLTPKEWEAKKG